jgi:hypothetical protein
MSARGPEASVGLHEPQNIRKQLSWDGNLGRLKGDIAAMAAWDRAGRSGGAAAEAAG